MIHTRPTNDQLESCQEVVEWLTKHAEVHEPWAQKFIEAGTKFAEEMPTDVCDITEAEK